MSSNHANPTKTVFHHGRFETVLLSAVRHRTGRERIVLAFRTSEDMYIPLDGGRKANQELLNASQLFVRQTDDHDQCEIYQVRGHWPISRADREHLDAHVYLPIGETTDVLHLTGPQGADAELRSAPDGFVVVIDGSERAASAISAALTLADWYGRPCTVVAVTAGSDDLDTRHGVACQLDGTGLSPDDVIFVSKQDLDAVLFDMMSQRHIVVAPAFGVWALDGRLHGMVNGLVRHNAPAIVGIGPNVAHDWKPSVDQPLLVCVDDSEHAHHIVAKLEAFLRPPRGRVLVAHIAASDDLVPHIAQQVADEIHDRYGVPAEARTIVDASTSAAIAILAARTKSQLVITHSWHRPQSGSPARCSTSLTAVAHAPCPVAVLGE